MLPELPEIDDLTAAYIKQHPEVQADNPKRHFWHPWSWIRKAPLMLPERVLRPQQKLLCPFRRCRTRPRLI